MHSDPVAHVVLGLTLILVAAKLGGDLATRLKQPAVLGELVAGVLVGNLGLVGVHGVEWLKTDQFIDMFARIGVLILLFEVGLESTVGQMLKVGLSSLIVATLGVIAPMLLGYFVGVWLLPNHSSYVHWFLGATLTATSVGITARVLKDLGKSKTVESRIILGAAVIDDVLGLVVLAVVGGVIAAADHGGTAMSYGQIAGVFGKAAGFLVGALVLGVLFSRRIFWFAAKLRSKGVLVAIGLAFCFILSYLADLIGLAPIVGAFAAGLILEDAHYTDFKSKGEHQLEELIAPISSFLAPVFFVVMGLRTDLTAFANVSVLWIAAMLTLAAIVGKQVCGLGVGRGVDRLSVGIGMIPRGEVGLVFAAKGLEMTVKGEHIVEKSTYAAVLIMIIVTTLVTPPFLKWSLSRREKKQ
jgi:Kef-type K+ transport system membrane component KefB